jgi:nucleoside-diphosphate-sugar epimerase
MFYDLFEKGRTVVPIAADVKFPLIYNPDLLDSILQLMKADESKLTARTYTIKSIGVSVGDYVEAVMKHFPNGKVEKDWGHNLSYSLETMVGDMHSKIKQLLKL